MKKKLANEIGKAFIRLHCPHLVWRNQSPLESGSFCRGVIVCTKCGKVKFIEHLKDYEILDNYAKVVMDK